MFTALDEKASDLAQLFCTEAERLWTQEGKGNTLLNAASAQLLSLAYLGHGKDHYVLKYLSAALRIGTRLSLFGVDPTKIAPGLRDMSTESRRASSYTAWGVFNWAV